jgi:ADP-ribose pyrophosphatase YjhB (NUDIX family)
MQDKIRTYVETLKKTSIPQLSLNCVILGYHEKKLKVVVNRIHAGDKVLLVLPGGYVKQEEDLSDAVERTVRESTGLENMLFRQFAVFGKASRSFAEELVKTTGPHFDFDPLLLDWLSSRFISLCYVAVVDYRNIDLKPTGYTESAHWLPLDQAETLAMDHCEILESARQFLAKEWPYTPIPSNLLPPQFSLPDLLALVESILNRRIDRPNFRRKILGTAMLEKVGLESSGKGRPADMYRFKHGKDTTLMDELKFGF